MSTVLDFIHQVKHLSVHRPYYKVQTPRPSYLQVLQYCCEIGCCEAQLKVLEVGLDQHGDGLWYLEKTGFPDELMRN